MIFVTVGTHEQPFNRLVEYMDNWAMTHDEDVIVQTGFSTYEPSHCEWKNLFPYQKMIQLVGKARIVITHGGPSSFIMPLQINKVPVVVPRIAEYGEHVNNHQVNFCEKVAERQGNIIVIKDIDKLANVLENYDQVVRRMSSKVESNNAVFCMEFSKLVNELMK